MASVAFDLFLPEVLPECPGVPEPVAINAIRNACFDFCRRSLVWSEFQDAEAYQADIAEYQVSAPSNAQVAVILGITLDDKRTIYPASIDEIAAGRPAWRTATGAIEWFVTSDPDTFRFVAVPDVDGTFVAQVAYTPKRTATTTDASLYNFYLETIKYGSLWKLKSMLGQPWSDPAGATTHFQMFQQGIGKAITERTRSNSRAALRVASVPFV